MVGHNRLLTAWTQFHAEHQREMIELSIGKVVGNTPPKPLFIKYLCDFADEINAYVVVGCDTKKRHKASVHKDLWSIAVSQTEMSHTALIHSLLLVFVNMHRDRVIARYPSSKRPRQFAGRVCTGDINIADHVEDLRQEGVLDVELLESMIDLHIPSAKSPFARRKKSSAGRGKAGSLKRRKQLARRAEREERARARAAAKCECKCHVCTKSDEAKSDEAKSDEEQHPVGEVRLGENNIDPDDNRG